MRFGPQNLPEAWEIASLKTAEKEVAYRLIGQLHYGGYLLADGEYDASYLYDRAWEQGYQLVAPFRKGKNPGSGKHYQSLHRLHSIDLMQHEFGRGLYKVRTQIERFFGNATSFGGGLAPLPASGARTGSSANLGLGQAVDQCGSYPET